jgi:hypothetical protein
MGEVYRARHGRLDKLVALKVLPAAALNTPERVARFLREMKAVGRLDHPNVVEAHDAGEEAGVVYLAMKLIDGTDLDALVKQRGPLPVPEACELARQAAVGLQYLHERGLVHRDVKPSNLMRTAEGVVKVLDLGLARWWSAAEGAAELSAAGAVLGTPDYLAPEQVRAAAVDGRADLYGLGGTLFYLLTARAPFAHHRGAYEKFKAHDQEQPPDVRSLRPEVPDGVAELVGRLLAKQPQDRPASAAEAAEALAGFTETVTLLPPGPRTGRHRSRRLWLAVCGACVAALSLGLALWWTARDRPRQGPAVSAINDGLGAVTEKVRVLGLEVVHYANEGGRGDRPAGVLGQKSFATRRDDSVEVRARLSRPAYAYLIAFRPDGTDDLCFPEKADEEPPLTQRPAYPFASQDVNYGLNEGEGLEVFAVVVSSRPLPAYKAWRAGRGAPPWGTHAATPDVVWWDDGTDLLPLTADGSLERAAGQEVRGKTPVARLAAWLRQAPEVEAVAAVGFAVLPRDKP